MSDLPEQGKPIPKALLIGNLDLNDSQYRMHVNLLVSASKQIPPGTLPDDDRKLAVLAGVGLAVSLFRRHKKILLKDWLLQDDGRWHHPRLAD